MDVKVLTILLLTLCPLPSDQQAGWTSLGESKIDGRYQDRKEDQPNLTTNSRDSNNDGWTSLLESSKESHRDGRLEDHNKKVSRQTMLIDELVFLSIANIVVKCLGKYQHFSSKKHEISVLRRRKVQQRGNSSGSVLEELDCLPSFLSNLATTISVRFTTKYQTVKRSQR